MQAADSTEPVSWTHWNRPEMRAVLGRTEVVVLYGGASQEREVSLESGRAVVQALAGSTDDAPAPGALPAGSVARVRGVEIDEQGRWRVEGRVLEPSEALAQLPAAAVYFPALHGGEGEDGTLQDFLGTRGRRYVGSGVAASGLCMDKARSRLAFRKVGLTTAPGRLVRRAEWGSQRRRILMELAALGGGRGWVVKPNRGGSSVGARRVDRIDELAAALEGSLVGDDALVESCVVGLEVTVAVLGNPETELVTLPPVEILPREGRFFDYEEKYGDDGAGKACPPEQLSEVGTARVVAAALEACRVTGVEGVARVDFIVPDGATGGERRPPVILEVNTLPGLSPHSLLPVAAAAAGVSFGELCLELVALAQLKRGPQ